MTDAALSLSGRTALVTGAAGGLGKSIATKLASEGCNLALTDLGDSGDAEAHLAEFAQFGVKAVYLKADLADNADVEAMFLAMTERLGPIDIVVNNAVTRTDAAIEALSMELWNRSVAVNLSASFQTIRLAAPSMRARGWGRIVNISSTFGLQAGPNRADYITTKHALIGLTRAIAMETLDDGITCNAVAPGFVRTARTELRIARFMEEQGLSMEEAVRGLLDDAPGMGHFVETVPEMVAFLCSDAGRDITGAVIPVDQGTTAGASSPRQRGRKGY